MKINKERLRQLIQEELEADAKITQPLDEDASAFLSNVLSSLPSGALQNFRGWVARKILWVIGIERGGLAYDIIVNHLEDWTLHDWTTMISGMGGADCYKKTSLLSKALLESMLEGIVEFMGVDATGIFMGTIREAVSDTLLKDMNTFVAKNICNISPEKDLGIKLGMNLKEAQTAFSERFGDNASILEEDEEGEKDKEEKGEKHFSPSQSPGEADETFSDCIKSVKKSFKKYDYKADKGDTVEDAAAKICTDSRKDGGATLNWGTSRECDVERKRPGGKTGKEKKCR